MPLANPAVPDVASRPQIQAPQQDRPQPAQPTLTGSESPTDAASPATESSAAGAPPAGDAGDAGDGEAPGKTEPADEGDEKLTVPQVKDVPQAMEASESIEDEKQSEDPEENAAKVAPFEDEAKATPKLLEEAKREVDAKLPAPVAEVDPDATLAQWEQTLSPVEEDLQSAQEALKKSEVDANAKTSTDRKAALAKAKENAEQSSKEAESELGGMKSGDANEPGTAARQIASQAHPALRQLAERNAELVESRQMLSRNLEKVSADLESLRALVVALDADFTDVTKRVDEHLPKEMSVTLADVILSLFALIAALIAAKTLPELLEISVLGRLPMEAEARHAATIIGRWAVSIVGLVLACRMIGIGWSSVQWLIAAMAVGLGFGLQEIFADLVSGLILLFERPIRIGDLVTVNGQTGKITRMQIRATTITDFDRRELIVPNKRFITQDVVNWTLSDPITRFVVPISIAYSSDPAEAQRLLLDVARRHPLVLDEPKPSAPFLAFGDGTLNLELRAFIGRRDDDVAVRHEVNLAIKHAFDQAGIEIAVPQQEIHIRSLPVMFQQPVAEDGSPRAKAA